MARHAMINKLWTPKHETCSTTRARTSDASKGWYLNVSKAEAQQVQDRAEA